MDGSTIARQDAGRDHSREQLERFIAQVVGAHADGLLRLARRHSLCADDAQDAYQRGMEIFLRHAHRLDPEGAPAWLRTVVKHEAMAVRRLRQRDVAGHEVDLDLVEARDVPSPEERAISFERVARSAEALRQLKPQEVRALWLRAEGRSYAEIQQQTGWTRTKVNRCLYEGRRSFLERYAGIESGAECARWEPSLSALVDGELAATELAQLRPHLRGCQSCRALVRELHRSQAPLAALFPAALACATCEPAQLEPAAHVFGRLHDSITGWLGERAASSAVRAQLLIDGVAGSSAKLTAVAASAAAVAGGGAVAAHRVGRDLPLATPPARADRPANSGNPHARRIARHVVRGGRAARPRVIAAAAAVPAAPGAPPAVPDRAVARVAPPVRQAASAPAPAPAPAKATTAHVPELGIE